MLRIGIVGHRSLADIPKIRWGIREALQKVDAHFPAQDWIVISALAEGADCLAAEEALSYKPALLVVVLPLQVEEYLSLFKETSYRLLFSELLQRATQVIAPPPAASYEQAFSAAGKYVVEHSDLLLAVWDGQPAQGLGGTGEAVALARHLPVAWVHAANGTNPAPDQGQVSLERFPSSSS